MVSGTEAPERVSTNSIRCAYTLPFFCGKARFVRLKCYCLAGFLRWGEGAQLLYLRRLAEKKRPEENPGRTLRLIERLRRGAASPQRFTVALVSVRMNATSAAS